GVRAVFALGSIAFVVASIGASPAAAWLDAGELGAAGFELGVMHPPGMPGLGAAHALASAVPLGPIGFRLALVSAVFAALAVVFTVRILERRETHPWIVWGTALLLVAGLTFERHARGVELYAPQLAALAFVADGFDPARPVDLRLAPRLRACFVATWAIWCFAELRMLLPPVLLVAWISALRNGRPFARWAPPVVVMATLVVLALPLASARAPFTDWGDPETLARLVDHVLARSIREAYAEDMLPRSLALLGANASDAMARMGEDLGPSGPVLAAIALVLSWVGPAKLADRRALATVTWWTLGSAFYAIAINPMGGPDRQTGLVLDWCAIVTIAVAADRLLRSRPQLRVAVVPLVWTMLILPAGLRTLPDGAAMRSWAPHAWTRAALAQLPADTMLLTQSDDLSAGIVWARVIEGARPDLFTAPAQHLHRAQPDDVPPEHADAWAAIAAANGEAKRIEAAIAAWPGAVALEQGVIFGRVRFEPEAGRLPLGVRGPGALALAATDTVPAQIAALLPWLPSDVDRRRLAVAIAAWARAHVQRGGDVGEAIAALQSSLQELDPDHASAMVTLGSLYDRLGDDASAIEWTQAALAKEPTRSAALLNLALYLSRDPARREQALALCERAVELRPWRADGWLRLAELRALAGDADGAAAARAEAERLR
ncbi:MAG TPA: DUF2723 domain-containing protein, partial [Nannocystaceae bacterium]|nr:DUF2723 domain-containing protein [Nannocystaceae bacterium]